MAAEKSYRLPGPRTTGNRESVGKRSRETIPPNTATARGLVTVGLLAAEEAEAANTAQART
jgi:hypothetical protein